MFRTSKVGNRTSTRTASDLDYTNTGRLKLSFACACVFWDVADSCAEIQQVDHHHNCYCGDCQDLKEQLVRERHEQT
jgi:hypothetical protein